MLRWLLFLLTLFLALLGLLTCVRSPDWSKWVLALLAGEFGHYLAVASLAFAVLAWAQRDTGRLPAYAGCLLGCAAAGLFLKPTYQAWRLGQALPGRLATAFGPADLGGRAPFSPADFLGGPPAPVVPEMRRYHGELALDFYRARRDHAPCVILVHGGGWDGGDRTELQPFDFWLVSRGYAVAAISYRLAPQATWPAPRDDLRAAIAHLQAHAGELGIDATRLVVFGRSAGGHLAEATVYGMDNPPVRGVIAFYAPADLNFAWAYARDDDVLRSPELLKKFLGGPPATQQARYDDASAILKVTPRTVPTLLLHGDLDTLVWNRQSLRLAARLEAAGVPQVLVELPWATHAVEYNLHGPGGQLATYAVEWFLQAVTR